MPAMWLSCVEAVVVVASVVAVEVVAVAAAQVTAVVVVVVVVVVVHVVVVVPALILYPRRQCNVLSSTRAVALMLAWFIVSHTCLA